MRCGCGPLPQRLLLVLALLAPPGDGNEGSVTGNCHCDTSISRVPSGQLMDRFRSHLKAYNRCHSFIRFQLPTRSVCGGTQDPWARELVRCFDRRECGDAHSKSLVNKEHLSLSGTPVPKRTEGPPLDTSTPAQPHLPSTQQSTRQLTRPPGVLPWDPPQSSPTSVLTHLHEATTPPADHRVEAGARTQESLQQGQGGATAETGAAAVPVLSLLTVVFFLTGVLLYVLCKRRRQQSLQNSPDLHLHYIPVRLESNT